MLSVSVKMNTFGWMLWSERAKARISKYQVSPIPRKRRTKVTIWSILLDLAPPLDVLLQEQGKVFYILQSTYWFVFLYKLCAMEQNMALLATSRRRIGKRRKVNLATPPWKWQLLF